MKFIWYITRYAYSTCELGKCLAICLHSELGALEFVGADSNGKDSQTI